MLVEKLQFRVKADHELNFGFLLTRSELIYELKKFDINRSKSWPYSIPKGSEVEIKNHFGKLIRISRNL